MRMMQVDLYKIKSMRGTISSIFHMLCSWPFWGILSLWDSNIFVNRNVVCIRNMVIVDGMWIALNLKCFMVNVYACKIFLRKKITGIIL